MENQGTYVGVRFTEESNKKLREYALSLGLEPIENFHATVVYSEVPLMVPHDTLEIKGTLTPESLMYLGEKGSKYRAVAIKVKSEILQEIFDFYTNEYGYENRHDDFLQHVSLTYNAPEGLDLSSLPLPDFNIEVAYEYVEGLNND